MLERKSNSFPMEVLPVPVQNYFNDLVKYNKLNADYLGGCFISLVSAYIGNKYRISYNENFNTNVCVWVALVGSSSTKKTPSINKVFEPLMKSEIRRHKQFKEQLAQIDPNTNEKRPIEKQMVVDDITIESLYQILYLNPHGVIMKRDELDSLLSEEGRYSSGGTTQKYLSLFSGVMGRINRKKDNESYLTEKGFLSMIGGVQTEILSKVFSGDRDKNGFVQRVLFVETDNSNAEPPIRGANERLKIVYDYYCQKLELIPDPNYPNIPSIDLNWDAYNFLFEWLNNELYPNYVNGDYSQLAKSYFMKMEAYTLKFALIMEVLNREDKSIKLNEVGVDSVRKAIAISDYFINSFLSVLDKVNDKSEELRKYSIIIDYINNLSNKQVLLKPIARELKRRGDSLSSIAKFLQISKSTVFGYLK